MSLSKVLYPLLSAGSIQEAEKCPDINEILLAGTKGINTTKTPSDSIIMFRLTY